MSDEKVLQAIKVLEKAQNRHNEENKKAHAQIIKLLNKVLDFSDKQNLHTAKRVTNLEIKLGYPPTPEIPKFK